MSRSLAALALVLAWGASACGGSTDGDSGSGGSGSGGSTGGGGTAGSLVGTWSGYFENFEFQDGSDKVTLTITSGALEGSVTFGDSPPLPKATDPNAGYPPGVNFQNPMSIAGAFTGFAYTVTSPSFDGDRLQLDIATNELWKDWCAMQTPILDEFNQGENYSCVPNWGSGSKPTGCFLQDPNTMQEIAIDCGKLWLCGMSGPCSCTAQGCGIKTDGGGIHFDMSVVLPKADGSVSGAMGQYNVHFKKN